MRDHFSGLEERRMLQVLINKKANSICGTRDPIYITRLKQKACLSLQRGLLTSRRSLSIYSEGQAIPAGEYDPRKFQWRYRVKNRDFIPDFFPNNLDNVEVVNDKVLRLSTPEKLTYHLPKEEQHHDI